mgnify:CR=1 FL=1
MQTGSSHFVGPSYQQISTVDSSSACFPKTYLCCSRILLWALALSLLVLRVLTDNPDLTLSLNDFALVADRFY